MKAVPLLLLKGPHFKIHFGSLDTKKYVLEQQIFIAWLFGRYEDSPPPPRKNHISHEQRQSFGLLNN